MNSEDRQKIFRGQQVNIQQLEHSNTVRIFISSTFSDMSNERNMLLENAYPQLRHYCQENGLDFQVMDMRWGIQNSANIDHSICKICLQEIATCERLSIGPYFVAFIGNRYGYRPIPSSIDSVNFEQFCQLVELETPEDASLLKKWYRRDDNAVPPCHNLRPITSVYSYFDDSDPASEEKKQMDRLSWEKTFQKLSEILRHCAKLALNKELLEENDAALFFKSVTQLEIEKGISNKTSNSNYFYMRNITNLKKFVEEPLAYKFVDKNENGSIDDEAQDLLEKLKNKMAGSEENFGSVKKYHLNWVSDKGINTQFKSHASYLDLFCTDFVKDIKSAIKAAQSRSTESLFKEEDLGETDKSTDWVLEEITHHMRFGKTKWETFCGRKKLIENALQKLLKYESPYPTIVYGGSGKGKTALMAKIAQCCQEDKSCDVVAFRFLGTSSNSSSIHNVLQALVLQIRKVLDLPIPESHLLQNFDSLVKIFADCLQDASRHMQKKNKNLIIILDSLDQMTSMNGAYRLKWMPKQIPANVKILVSTLPDQEFGILDRLRQLFPEENFLEVPDLSWEDGKEILQTLLSRANRTLTEDQNQLVTDAFIKCPTPLFVKLVFDEARTWHSYTDITTIKMAVTAQDAISLLFDRLEIVHSRLFVSRTIGYIVATRSGITENELDDLLSLDDEMLDNSYQHWSPSSEKVVRIPSLLWSRFRQELGEDLVERQANGYRVLALYHRQFAEAARNRYLDEEDVRKSIHRAIAQYFLGVWSNGREKPLKLKIWKNKVVNTDRQAASQPNRFSENKFNYRKLSELPYHLTAAGMKQELVDSVLCNAQWIFDKIKAFSIKSLIEDYEMALNVNPDGGISLIRDALKLAKPTLEFSGGIRNHVFAEIVGRLAFFSNDFPETIGKLVKEASELLHENKHVKLIPLNGCFQPPGGSLRTTLTGFQKPVACMAADEEGSILVAGSQDGQVIVWRMGEDEVLYNTKAHDGKVTCLAVAGSRVVSGSIDDTLVVMNFETERCEATICEDHVTRTDKASLALNKAGNVLASSSGETIRIWDLENLQCKYTFESDSRAAISCQVLLEEDLFVFAIYEDGTSIGWSITTGEKQYEISPSLLENYSSSNLASKSLSRVVFHCIRASRHFFLDENGIFSITNLSSGKTTSYSIESKVHTAAISESGDILAVGCGNNVEVLTVSDDSAQALGTLCYHRKPITTIIFHGTSNVLFVASKDKTMTMWSFEKSLFGKNTKPLEVILGMGASVDNLFQFQDVLASGSSEVFYIKLWNWNRKKIVEDPRTEMFTVDNNIVSPCSSYLAVCNYLENSLVFREIFTSLNSTESKSSVKIVQLDKEKMTCLCFCSDDSGKMIIGTKSGKLILVFNPFLVQNAQNKEMLDLNGPGEKMIVKSISTIPDNSFALVTACNEEDNQSSKFFIIDLKYSVVTYSSAWNKFGLKAAINTSCFVKATQDQFMLFAGTEDCKIYVLVAEKVKESNTSYQCHLQQTLSEHDSPLKVLKLSDDGKTLFSGSSGRTKRLWRVKNGNWQLHKRLYFKSLLKPGTTTAAFTKDRKYIVSGSRERSIKVWDVESGLLVAAQYVYATVTGLHVTEDDRIIASTKMGYVIVDKFKVVQSPRSLSKQPARAKIVPIVRKSSTKSNSEKPGSSICSII